MTKRETQRSESGLSPRAQEIVADIRRINAETKKRIETMTPPCPLDELPGEYQGSVGTGHTGRVSVQYRCPNGDIFGWDFNENTGYIISNPGQGSTPLEAK